jgi:aerobic-type carbon monoxide dehydrogenase small subunit (CoxS/CutS family)
MILTTVAFLKKNPAPTRQEIMEALDENLCRCTAHVRIIDAVLAAAKEMKGGK